MLLKLIFSSPLLIAKVLGYTKFLIEEEVDGSSTFKSTFYTQLVNDLDCSLASTVTVTEGPVASTQTVFVMVDLDGVQLIAGTASVAGTKENSCTDDVEEAAGSVASVASALVAAAEETTVITKYTVITSNVETETPCESGENVATKNTLDPSGYFNASGTTVLSATTVTNGTTILETASSSINNFISSSINNSVSSSFSSSPINSTTPSNSEIITTGFASLTSSLSTTSTNSINSSDSSSVSTDSVSSESSISTISTSSVSSSNSDTVSTDTSITVIPPIVSSSVSHYTINMTFII